MIDVTEGKGLRCYATWFIAEMLLRWGYQYLVLVMILMKVPGFLVVTYNCTEDSEAQMVLVFCPISAYNALCLPPYTQIFLWH